MKNIFRKNQVIITALVLMIVIAGYLNFTNDKVANQKENQNSYVQADSKNVASDGTNVDVDSLLSSADLASDDFMVENAGDTDDLTADTKDKSSKDVASSDSKLTTDISDEDELAASDDSIPVSDSGELVTSKKDDKTNSKDSTGDAVLVNNTISSGYFSKNKLKREQNRAQERADLLDIINDKNVSDEQKEVAIDSIVKMNEIKEKENVTESLIEANGFENVLVLILDNSVNVVIETTGLSDQQLAQIESIVKDKTGVSIENINIKPVKTK
ncbi:SpoIIIAH-like family protein [Anaeromicropila herbilytica]|uniref:Stage III sporulation protein AH n=1 Tax=Anaeromicropila herbilytica TaxID=2785025 RepID=A0A7R7IDU9_9FIRM|nr:SpoIIIAH-like family protein [Anaeromicropila herbilytica]BCN30398.1 hypothetical protein bsdtb5_16930 [Anaeromicropila herbilytica]